MHIHELKIAEVGNENQDSNLSDLMTVVFALRKGYLFTCPRVVLSKRTVPSNPHI